MLIDVNTEVNKSTNKPKSLFYTIKLNSTASYKLIVNAKARGLALMYTIISNVLILYTWATCRVHPVNIMYIIIVPASIVRGNIDARV